MMLIKPKATTKKTKRLANAGIYNGNEHFAFVFCCCCSSLHTKKEEDRKELKRKTRTRANKS